MSNEHIKYLKKERYNKIFITTMQIFILIGFLSMWELLSYYQIINSFIFSSPSLIIKTLYNLFINYHLINHILVTLYEIIIAFSIGISIGLVIAIIMYSNNTIAKIMDPYLTLINSLPKVALGPIIIIWIGANNKSIITMALLINLILSIVTIYDGFKHTDQNQILLLKSFNASKWQIIKYLIIPSSYETIISSLKINISMTLIGVIMGEFLVSKAGIGYLIIYGTQIFNLNIVMSGILLLIIISFVLYKLVSLIQKKNIFIRRCF